MDPEVPVRIEAARLREMASGCGWTLAELADFYAPRAHREFDEVVSAHAAGDVETLARVAHGAAGSTSTVGLVSLSDLYREIETGVGAPDAPLDDLLRSVEIHLERTLATLEELGRAED